ncbi:sodium:solute symporter [Bacillus salipaludis]|uniref:sodium:solute symporter family protein n=1 Tax=Bacillus salipaludis TaxID=2547811 RepID=UPI002E1DD53F|nr:sodium:solute symporter [Bacillus salipaludis]
MNVALIMIFGCLLISLYLGIKARRGKKMNLEEWAVGGRGFGTIFTFFLGAGESFTTFTFLGASGWAYSKGAPSYYILAYLSLAYILAYFILPKIWQYGKKHNLVSHPDLFVSKYKSKSLGVLVALVGMLPTIAYIVLQFKGLGIIVSATSYGKISPDMAIWISVISVTIYVMISGIHGSAWTAVMKDILVLSLVVFIGIYMPFHYYGGIHPMFQAVSEAKPDFFTFPEKGLNLTWYISTVLLTVIGYYMFPHTFGPIYSAKSGNALRRNAVITPLYTLMLLFILFVGFTAVLQIPGLERAAGDLALLKLVTKTFDPWFVGLIGAAGLLTALVPGSVLLMTGATILTKNVYKVFFPNTTDEKLLIKTKLLVPMLSAIGLYFALDKGNSLVTLSLMAFNLATQFFPPLVAAFFKNSVVTKQGAFTGIIVGVGIVAYVTITKTTMATLFPFMPLFIQDLNIGFIALVINAVSMVIVSIISQAVVKVKDKSETI